MDFLWCRIRNNFGPIFACFNIRACGCKSVRDVSCNRFHCEKFHACACNNSCEMHAEGTVLWGCYVQIFSMFRFLLSLLSWALLLRISISASSTDHQVEGPASVSPSDRTWRLPRIPSSGLELVIHYTPENRVRFSIVVFSRLHKSQVARTKRLGLKS